MTAHSTLLLTRREVAQLLTLEDCIVGVEQAFRLYGEGKADPPGVLGAHVPGGGFHIKAGVLPLAGLYFAAKLNANFPENRTRFALPTIQGVVALFDAANGIPLAVMDSIEITIKRTGAATAVAAKYLARRDSSVVTICGCGNQGRVQLAALRAVLPISRVYAFDVDPERAREFAEEFSRAGLRAEVTGDLSLAVPASDVCVTCTPSRRAFLEKSMVRAGTFIAAVGADHPEKQELAPALMRAGKIVVDELEQCATIGDLHHAIDAGVLRRSDVHASLAEVVAGRRPGRTLEEEITVFDSTGIALEDVAAAVAVYKRALDSQAGTPIEFHS